METILIIDNEPESLSQLRDMLDDGSYRFECAATGHEARQIVDERGEKVKTVLLDWDLSDARGSELLEWLRAHPSLAAVEVVIQSGQFDPGSIERAISCGAYFCLVKPFDEFQLQAIVRAAISACELRRELARKIADTESTFELLDEGIFRLRTIYQARLLAVHIGSAASDPQMGVGLLELLLNAVEHGNLEISYAEKTRLLADGTQEAEIARRLELPKYRDRQVEVHMTRHADRLEIVITDDGSGFDFERYLVMDKERLFDSHGRGIVLAGAALSIRYVPPGNKVEVTLPLHDARTGGVRRQGVRLSSS